MTVRHDGGNVTSIPAEVRGRDGDSSDWDDIVRASVTYAPDIGLIDVRLHIVGTGCAHKP